ncbi:MAG: hypothetical protein HY611_06835 [Elusimicrobia bacterium]|nr:hypothetical protein [Elusimicrobiota bacterium]
MMQILMTLVLSSMPQSGPTQTAQIQPCVWPNTCRMETVITTKAEPFTLAALPVSSENEGIIETCVWPRCS